MNGSMLILRDSTTFHAFLTDGTASFDLVFLSSRGIHFVSMLSEAVMHSDCLLFYMTISHFVFSSVSGVSILAVPKKKVLQGTLLLFLSLISVKYVSRTIIVISFHIQGNR